MSFESFSVDCGSKCTGSLGKRSRPQQPVNQQIRTNTKAAGPPALKRIIDRMRKFLLLRISF